MSLSDEQLDRYARHIILKEVGGEGQRRLLDAKVAVIGAGGLGSPLILYLAAAGVGTIGVIDDDVVELSNLQRQVLHTNTQLGALKTASAGLSTALTATAQGTLAWYATYVTGRMAQQTRYRLRFAFSESFAIGNRTSSPR